MSITYKIERGIRVPPMNRGGARKSMTADWPLDSMSLGDSFLIPQKDVPERPSNISARLIAYCKGVKAGRKFCTRMQYRNGRRIGIRVWRVK